MFPSKVEGTCAGFAGPAGHFNASEVTLPVAAEDALPSILYDRMQLFGLPVPAVWLTDVHPEALPEFEVTETLAEVLK